MTYWPVSPSLRNLADDIYVVRAVGPSYQAWTGALLPQVEWVLTGEMSWITKGYGRQIIDRAGALGPSRAAYQMDTRDETVVIGCGLYPEGWAALMPIAAGPVSEQVLPLSGLWGSSSSGLLDLDPALPDRELASAVDQLLLDRMDAAPPPDPRIAQISRWADQETHDLAALTTKLGLSDRQVQRLAQSAHGLSPMHLASKHKILRMAAVLALGEYDNRRDTWAMEYADQSHFIREFKRFIGVTPTRFVSEPDLFVREVMRVRSVIGSTHPLGLMPSAHYYPVGRREHRFLGR